MYETSHCAAAAADDAILCAAHRTRRVRDVETECANTANTFASDDQDAGERHPGRDHADDERPGQSGHRGDGVRGDERDAKAASRRRRHRGQRTSMVGYDGKMFA